MEKAVGTALRHARRLVIAVVGGTVVLAGVVMLVTPGPAMVVIPAGLAILAAEFAWARRLLKRVKQEVSDRIGSSTEADGRKESTRRAHEEPKEPATSESRAS